MAHVPLLSLQDQDRPTVHSLNRESLLTAPKHTFTKHPTQVSKHL